MSLSTLDHLVAAILASGRAGTFDLDSREAYLAEYEAFLALIVARRRGGEAERRAPWGDDGAVRPPETPQPFEERHIPSSV